MKSSNTSKKINSSNRLPKDIFNPPLEIVKIPFRKDHRGKIDDNPLNPLPHIDPWFPVRNILDLQSGCGYLCRYCPVNWKSGEKKIIFNDVPSFSFLKKIKHQQIIGLGAGYTDPFPPPEILATTFGKNYQKRIKILLPKILLEGHRLFVMTKNPQALFELLKKTIKPALFENVTVLCSLTFQNSFDPPFKIFEPNLPTIEQRWNSLEKFGERGTTTGIAYLPIIQGVNDDENFIYKILLQAQRMKIQFCIFGALDEKGIQHLVSKKILPSNQNPLKRKKIEQFFIKTLGELKILPLPPYQIYGGFLSSRDEAIVYLRQLFLYQNWLDKEKIGLLTTARILEKTNESDFYDFFFKKPQTEEKKQSFYKKSPINTVEPRITTMGPRVEHLLKTLILRKKTTHLYKWTKYFK